MGSFDFKLEITRLTNCSKDIEPSREYIFVCAPVHVSNKNLFSNLRENKFIF